MQIKPASNNQIKLWRKLLTGKYRKKKELFIAEGERCVEQLIQSGYVDVEAIVLEENFESVSGTFKNCNVPFFSADKNDFASISDTETPQGVLAVCKIPGEANSGDLNSKTGLLVAMDAVQDPGNVGTMIRTASWFGVAGILFGKGTVDPFHPKVVRSTAGATGALPYLKASLGELFRIFEEDGWQVCLMHGSDEAEELGKVKRGEKTILVIGNEANGISPVLFTPGRKSVKIPGRHQSVESLNAAIALGIGLYHFIPNFSR